MRYIGIVMLIVMFMSGMMLLHFSASHLDHEHFPIIFAFSVALLGAGPLMAFTWLDDH